MALYDIKRISGRFRAVDMMRKI
ncbi:MAG: hypothetical protein CG446_612, partial [Methanosaeta sp. ASO1]